MILLSFPYLSEVKAASETISIGDYSSIKECYQLPKAKALTLNVKELKSVINSDKIIIRDFPDLSGNPKTVILNKTRNITDENTEFIVAGKNRKEIQIPELCTYTGTIENEPGSFVFFFIAEDLLFALSETADGSRNCIVPTADNPRRNEYIVYNESMLSNERLKNFTCGFDNIESEIIKRLKDENIHIDKNFDGIQSDSLLECEIAIETDSEFYKNTGSDPKKAQAYILALLSLVSHYYETETNICFYVKWLKIWTDNPKDPYNIAGDPFKLSDKVAAYWKENYKDVERDLAHVVTSVNYGGGGFGWFNALCGNNGDNSYATSSIQGYHNLPTYAFTYDVYVIAHEIGHNFNAPHSHSCFWGFPLDTCVVNDGIAGKCLDSSAKPKPNPGSIMSYCGGVNNQNGLGWQVRMTFIPQVASIIRQSAEKYTCLTAPANPKVSLLEPQGELTFVPGEKVIIKWLTSRIDNVDLFYSSDNGFTSIKISEKIQASAKSFEWTVPDLCSKNCRLYLKNSTSYNIYDSSHVNFTIFKENPEKLYAWYPFNGNSRDEEFCHFFNTTPFNNAKLTSDRIGSMNSAYEFDGASYLVCPNFKADFKELTVSWWFNSTDFTGKRNFVGTDWQAGWVFETYFWGQFGVSYYIDGNGGPTQMWGGNLPLNQWTHCAFTFDGDTARLYKNGVKAAEQSDGKKHKLNVFTKTPLYIGSRAGNDFFAGKIDDIRIYNRALSEDEVNAVYNEKPVTITEGQNFYPSQKIRVIQNQGVDEILILSDIPAGLHYWYKIFNYAGDEIISGILQEDTQVKKINISSLPAGVYFVVTGESKAAFFIKL